MPIVYLSDDFQIEIPAGVREQAGLRSGDELRVEVEDGRIVVRSVALARPR